MTETHPPEVGTLLAIKECHSAEFRTKSLQSLQSAKNSPEHVFLRFQQSDVLMVVAVDNWRGAEDVGFLYGETVYWAHWFRIGHYFLPADDPRIVRRTHV